MTPVLDEAQRYLAWLGAQGPLTTVHPWIALTAADLAQRIRWRPLAPERGAGRLLWMCEEMAAPAHTTTLVPAIWRAARRRDISSPDWPGTTPPDACRLTSTAYRNLLANRTTGTRITLDTRHVRVLAPNGSTVIAWNGTAVTRHIGTGTPLDIPCPLPGPDDLSAGRTGAAVFTRADRTAVGWTAA
ncbi:hypothetical protein [Streptomyces acidicola]|uniref:hypothetical protein n=1 Tax=Streptomyces acidicola TaxID=2596892 RepID=UPI0034235B46